jgi:hypothetical protein
MMMAAYDEKSASQLLDAVLPTLRSGATVAVVASTFRQSKAVVSDLAERAGTKLDRDVDQVKTKVYGRQVVGLPAGSGDRVRGRRDDLVVVINPLSVTRESVETVLLGQAASESVV